MKPKHDIRPHFEDENIPDGFHAPESYFYNLEAELYEHLDLEETLLDVKEDGMCPKANYFDQLEAEVIQKIEPTSRAKVEPLFSVSKHWTLAACFLALLGLFALWQNFQVQQTDGRSMAQQYDELSEPYVQENLYFLSDEDLEYILETDSQDNLDDLDLNPTDLELYLMINEAYNLK
ncbi:hypothetical protein [Psychroflexus tropicus]|uniref:hypothetical protein n=1 Tax=Psychroflexus tropicus TaxID=197345 RepID=UPI00035CA59B|nr:hypothetical protein [Psychroflexus tropicus]